MSALEDLKKIVKDAVASNKLSSSRVEAVKKASSRCFDRSHLVKPELLKLHTSAPTSSKICSLYLFDAIVRNAKDVVRKNGVGYDAVKLLPGTAKASDPTAALVSSAKEFLDEMASIVLDIAVDTVKSVKPDLREKVDKVIDIWRKAGTFEAALLDQVEAAVKSASASTSSINGKTTPSQDPRVSSTRPPKGFSSVPSTTPPNSPPRRLKEQFGQGVVAAQSTSSSGLPPNLAALLGSGPGANGTSTTQAPTNTTQDFMKSLSSLMGGGQTSSNTSGPPPQPTQSTAAPAPAPAPAPSFDLSQLTALQQLGGGQKNTAISTSKPTQSPPPQAPPPTTWPPPQNDSTGDLTTFDVYTFNPTQPTSWTELAQRWANSYGYMPSLPELGLSYLMFYQAALVSSMGDGAYQGEDAPTATGAGTGAAQWM